MMMLLKVIVLWTMPLTTLAFGGIQSCQIRVNTFCLKACSENDTHEDDDHTLSRRSMMFQTTLAAWGSWSTLSHAAASIGTSSDQPVVILGGGGRTGMAVAEALAKEGLYAVTTTRSGNDPFRVIKLPQDIKSRLTHFEGSVDVCQPSSLLEALREIKPSAIVFAASASKQGGNAFAVDDEGVGHAAEAARTLNARFILVSALAVDRPESKSYKITNTLGGNLDKIMDAKRQGEDKVRSTLKNYVIIRPGPLLNGKGKNGAADIELNQGDMIGGGLSREELAGVVVGALMCGKRGATVEAYRKSTATKLQPEFDIPSGRESTSDSYVGLFANIKEEG